MITKSFTIGKSSNNKYKILIISLALVLMIFDSCKKEDSRDKYVGDWEFKVDESSFSMLDSSYTHDSTTYIGKILLGNVKNELLIQYTKDNSIALTVNDNGGLSNFPTIYCHGEFNGTNNLHFYLRSGGLGGGMSTNVQGMKK